MTKNIQKKARKKTNAAASSPASNSKETEAPGELNVNRLERILNDDVLYRELLHSRDADAQVLLDVFQWLLEDAKLGDNFRRGLIVAAQRLSTKSGLYPVCYELKDVIRHDNLPVTAGGFADIYKGTFKGQVVCLKTIRIYQDTQIEHVLKIFSKEVMLWAQLSHKNILPIYGLFRFDKNNRLCIVAPWMKNGDIVAYLKRNPNVDRHPMANILIDDVGVACLCDFGIASICDPEISAWSTQSSVSSKGGSTRWQAPELFDVEDGHTLQNTTSSDVYAFGCVCYEIFTGRVPLYEVHDAAIAFRVTSGQHPRKPTKPGPAWDERGLTEGLWSLMADCWEMNVNERPTVGEIIERLRSLLRQSNRTGDTTLLVMPPMSFRRSMGQPPERQSLASFDKLCNGIENKGLSNSGKITATTMGGENQQDSVSHISSSSNISQDTKPATEPKVPKSQKTQPVLDIPQTLSMPPVAPLQISADRWDRKAMSSEVDPVILVDRKVKALLNKLTMEKFDSMSDQIVAWVNKSENENDGKTLIQVTRLVFEKATDEAIWSEMYARLCRKMMECIIPTVRDEGIATSDGKPITGGQLFRKYLLNRCQEEFEHGWLMEQAVAAAAASKAAENQAIEEAAQKNGSTEDALYSDNYYAAQKAKRRSLGLTRFIGELFKLQMLTERIVHECIKIHLGSVDTPEEEVLASFCALMKTVGSMIDTPRAAGHMDVVEEQPFGQLKDKILGTSPLMHRVRSSRLSLNENSQDVIELRECKWVNRNIVAVPATIAQIHENAYKEKAAAEKDSFNRQVSMSRGGSNLGDGDRSDFPQFGPGGWAVAAGNGRPPPKAVDLSNFGKITKNTAMTFGPSNVFAGKKSTENKRESVSRSRGSSNMFSMLSQGTKPAAESKEPELQRKRLALVSRSKPAADDVDAESENEVESEAKPAEPTVEMTEEQANQKVAEDMKEFFAIHNLEEADLYFTALPPVHHFRLIEKLTSRAIEAKESFVQLLAEFFARVAEKQLCSPAAFEQGFMPIAETIEDITIDVPKAFTSFAIIVESAGLNEERKARLAAKSFNNIKFLELVSHTQHTKGFDR
ncbi:hypothetical protein DXG01_001452 [Tephrocybe rancida]|nr:hypothetical protein DXG01_001452 [Tephrocybe rancida]